ncbi:P1 family peptidase [Candidatus Villigracilis affinis]|uniref:P1 family peptidase n=1 Tax=Candidatus Villigracilis affinis TaxID=3140682 RepID=UPI001D50641F|nr:P1 family peptidase [Anaerolineales bacterium]
MKRNNAITDVRGIEVGHAQNEEALTGCTVILCRKGAVAGVDVRGGAPGTRETDLLDPVNLVEKIHAIVLAGGSAYGLDAASGVMRYLEEQKIGFNTGAAKVPIVPAAILYDLNLGRADVRPDSAMGASAAAAARGFTSAPPAEGNVGAGTGASVGKMFGAALAMKSGLGTASVEIGGGVIVGAIVAVNAWGDVIDPKSGEIIAGLRSGKIGPLRIGGKDQFADTLAMMKKMIGRGVLGLASRSNTVIGVVATNAKLTKAQATKVARMAQDGLARTVRPAHTMLDGDVIFALSTGTKKADVSTVGAFAAEAMSEAIIRAVKAAKSAGGLPGLKR